DQHERRLLDARPDATRPHVLEDRRDADALVHQPLDLVEQQLALAAIELVRLLLVERVDVRVAAVGIGAVARNDLRHARGGVAIQRARAHADAAQLLRRDRREERRALHGPHPDADAHGAEVADDRLAEREVRRQLIELTRIEAVRIAGLGQELPAPRGIVGVRLDGQRELEAPRHEIAGGPRGAERLRLRQRTAVDGVAGGEANAAVRPRRLRIPLIEEIEEERRDTARERQPQARVTLDLLRLGRVEQVGDVDLPALQHGHARERLRHHLEDEPLDGRHLAPVAVERLHDELDTRRVADELVRPEADRMLLESRVAHLLHVLPGHDPAGAGHDAGVVVHEVGPRIVQREAHAVRAHHGDLPHLLVQELALRAMEAELHVLGGERVAVVELQPLAQRELVRPLVGADRPRLRQTRRSKIAGQRLHQRVVQAIQDPEGCELTHGLTGIEPLRGHGEVERPAHLALGLGLGEGGAGSERKDEARGGDGPHPAGSPALTARTCPEMLRAMSLQKNTVASTMSSAVTMRLSGARSIIIFRIASTDTPRTSAWPAITRSMRSPSTAPGATQLTRMLCGASSRAMPYVMPTCPALAEQYPMR